MSVLKKLVELLAPYVSDIIPVAESEILKFATEKNILLRKDHLHFLMKFGAEPGGRPGIFKWYGGDFDFEYLKRETSEEDLEMELPVGSAFFGSSFAGDSFCIDHKSGGIFLYDEGRRYGKVHEGIDGFLLRCLLSVYNEEAFSSKQVQRELKPEFIGEFRLMNEKGKIDGATSFELEYKNIDCPGIISEYYLVGQKLMALYPPTSSLVTLAGGILERL